jgi:hypothetical protein
MKPGAGQQFDTPGGFGAQKATEKWPERTAWNF